MNSGLSSKAKVGVPGKCVSIDTSTYFLAMCMQHAGRLRPGQALMLAATLPNTTKPRRGEPKRGKK